MPFYVVGECIIYECNYCVNNQHILKICLRVLNIYDISFSNILIWSGICHCWANLVNEYSTAQSNHLQFSCSTHSRESFQIGVNFAKGLIDSGWFNVSSKGVWQRTCRCGTGSIKKLSHCAGLMAIENQGVPCRDHMEQFYQYGGIRGANPPELTALEMK